MEIRWELFVLSLHIFCESSHSRIKADLIKNKLGAAALGQWFRFSSCFAGFHPDSQLSRAGEGWDSVSNRLRLC